MLLLLWVWWPLFGFITSTRRHRPGRRKIRHWYLATMKRRYRIVLVLATGLAVMLPAEKVLANYNSPEARAQHDREQNEAARLDPVHMMAAFERNLRLAKRRLKRWQNRVKRDQRRLSDLEDRQKELQRAFSRYLYERLKPGGISKQTEQRQGKAFHSVCLRSRVRKKRIRSRR